MSENHSSYYQYAYDFALYTQRSVFITGKAGTGKTTFLHRLKEKTKKQLAIVAPTGVAAINAGGTTMHSFFQIPFSPFLPTAEERKNLIEKIKMQSHRRKVLQELELLVIDEVSMVRADVLDMVDTILRHIRYRHNEPFGGVQVIFIGDLFQLSPVVTDDERRLLSPYYASPYFFHSQVILQQPPVFIELDKIFRQSNKTFIELLNEIRNNHLSPQGIELLQSRYNPTFLPNADDTYITLTTHNYKADEINNLELSKLKGKTYNFVAEIKGEFNEKSYPTEEKLELKIGAKVMFIKNDTETPRRFFNGKIGIVERIDDDLIYIKCTDDDEVIELGKMLWENIRYSANETTKQIEEKTVGTFIQYPLRLAWAITIHKSQGLTFDKAVIDAGAAFASGQVYVALSRCRTLEGIVLRSKIQPNSIENSRQIIEYQDNKATEELLKQELTRSRNEFRTIILQQLFDYKSVVGTAFQLQRYVSKNAKSFNDETAPFAENITKQAENLQSVAEKFQSQLQGIMQAPVDEDFLSSRIQAAIQFFDDKTEQLLQTLKASPAITDSREHAREFDENVKNMFSFLAQKQHVLKNMKQPFVVEDYFLLKNTFYLPDVKISSYAKTSDKKPLNIKEPALYYELVRLRNSICEPHDTPIYLVAGNKTLAELSEYLPQNEKELLLISGFGKAKVEKYGEAFLSIIREYCTTHQLSSKIQEKEIKKTRIKKEPKEKDATPKKEKGETFRITFGLYRAGKSIDEIAIERKLAVSTIVSHLCRFIVSGDISIYSFLSEPQLNKALRIVQEKSEDVSAYSVLESIFTKNEIAFFLAWLRSSAKEK